MRKDPTYNLLLDRMHEISILPPQDAGPFTGIYKRVVPYLKYSPWKTVIILALLLTFFSYLFTGPTLIKLASLLQFGF